ncbi:hypothetical protein OY671_010217, partial [Metschnikowia pulcherrima]
FPDQRARDDRGPGRVPSGREGQRHRAHARFHSPPLPAVPGGHLDGVRSEPGRVPGARRGVDRVRPARRAPGEDRHRRGSAQSSGRGASGGSDGLRDRGGRSRRRVPVSRDDGRRTDGLHGFVLDRGDGRREITRRPGLRGSGPHLEPRGHRRHQPRRAVGVREHGPDRRRDRQGPRFRTRAV